MAGAPPTACRNSRFGCGGTCFPSLGKNYCADCEKLQATEKQTPAPQKYTYTGNARETAHDKNMHSTRWAKLSRLIRDLNPICQRIFDDGSRCRYPSKEVHHLSDDPALFFTPSNLVGLCKACHHKDQGEPADTPRFYSPTHYIMGAMYPHQLPPPPGKKLLFYSMGKPIYG